MKKLINATFVSSYVNNVTGSTDTIYLLKEDKIYYFPNDNLVWKVIFSNYVGYPLQMQKDGILIVDPNINSKFEDAIKLTSFQHFIMIVLS